MPRHQQDISGKVPLVIRRADFLAVLGSPHVQATLARARAILDSESFPPRDGRRFRGGSSSSRR